MDTGLAWQIAHSGKTVGTTSQFADMVARAGRDYDVLVVGYVSRFARNLRTEVNARHDLHAAGAAFLFADEDLLTSCERDWKKWADEAVEAEAYSRRMGRRQREGHAAKRRLGEPGGRPPFGYRRVREHPTAPAFLVEVPEHVGLVVEMYNLAAAGFTDRQVAHRMGRARTWVCEVLTNRIYKGELRDGSMRAAPIIAAEVWDRVQEQRSRYARRHPGKPVQRCYVLSALMFCRACKRTLTGHVGRYRHYEACEEFKAHRPRQEDPRSKGESYPQGMFESLVPAALAHIRLNAELLAGTQAAFVALAPEPDRLTLGRIERERNQVLARYVRDRDLVKLTSAMERLDADAKAAEAAPVTMPSTAAILSYLRDLPDLYESAEPETRRSIARALFDRVEVLGPYRAWVTPSPEAIANGWTIGMAGEFAFGESTYGRGERI